MNQYLLILGGGTIDNRPTPNTRIRVRAGIYEHLKHPEISIVFSEGGDIISGARAMYEYAKLLGYNKISILEEESRNTIENMKYTQEIIGPYNEIHLITQNFHLKRAERIAKDYFEKVYGTPAEDIILEESKKRPSLKHLLKYIKKKNLQLITKNNGKLNIERLKYLIYNILTYKS